MNNAEFFMNGIQFTVIYIFIFSGLKKEAGESACRYYALYQFFRTNLNEQIFTTNYSLMRPCKRCTVFHVSCVCQKSTFTTNPIALLYPSWGLGTEYSTLILRAKTERGDPQITVYCIFQHDRGHLHSNRAPTPTLRSPKWRSRKVCHDFFRGGKKEKQEVPGKNLVRFAWVHRAFSET